MTEEEEAEVDAHNRRLCEGVVMDDDDTNIEGQTGNVGEKKKITPTKVAAGTGSNDEVLNITVGKKDKKKKKRKSKALKN